MDSATVLSSLPALTFNLHDHAGYCYSPGVQVWKLRFTVVESVPQCAQLYGRSFTLSSMDGDSQPHGAG